MRVSMCASMEECSAPYCRDEPISNWPVLRGCTLNATESVLMECALLR